MIRHRFAILVAVLGLILASGVFSLAESAPSEQPLQPRATQTPAGVPTIMPTRPPRVTPTPEPTRPPRVTPTPEPTVTPRVTPTPVTPIVPTVIAPQPMPDQPGQGDSPPVTQQPAGRQPLIPGKHNRFEITLYTCPAGIDPDSDEAAFLASCALHVDAPPENVHFQMRDGDATHSTSDYDDDSMYVFDDITVTPGRKFFILEEFLPGFADPAVFCSENGGASARVPAPLRVIRPELSSYSNVDYACSWFKLPLTGDSIHLSSHTCLTAPNASASFSWFWINCPAPHDKFFTLTDANGSHTDGIVTSIVWTDVEFGPSDTVEISVPALDTGHENRVFCGDFNSGDELAVVDLAITVPKMGGDAPAEHVCRWYRFPGQASFDQSIQIPNTLDVWARLCPPDLDPAGDPHDYIVACQLSGTPAQGVEITAVYPSGQIAVLPASQINGNKAVAQFGLIGAGTVTVVPAMPSGYSSYRYICTSPGVSYPDKGEKPGLPTTWFGWGKTALCRIFYVPDSAAGMQPATASIPMAGVAWSQSSQLDHSASMPIDAARSRKARRRRLALAS